MLKLKYYRLSAGFLWLLVSGCALLGKTQVVVEDIKPPEIKGTKTQRYLPRSEYAKAVATAARDNERIAELVKQGLLSERQALPRIAVGTSHSCVLRSLGDVYCWGSNLSGEAGIEPDVALPCQAVAGGNSGACLFAAPTRPVRLDLLAKDIVAGISHSCALLDDGNVQCWGDNSHRQLGVAEAYSDRCEIAGSSFFCAQPTPPLPLAPVHKIAANGAHTCVISYEGLVQCWGGNKQGQLGLIPTEHSLPEETVDLPYKALEIATGEDFSCALLSNLAVHCWGDNSRGQLGLNIKANKSLSAAIKWQEPVKTILAGEQFACLISDASKLHCWGDNSNQQLGLTLPQIQRAKCPSRQSCPKPTSAVPELSGITRAVTGSAHACSLSQKELHCWGDNSAGQLGLNHSSPVARPTRSVVLLSAVADMAASHHTCLVSTDDSIICWGENSSKQLGLGLNTPSFIASPRQTVTFIPQPTLPSRVHLDSPVISPQDELAPPPNLLPPPNSNQF